jgi:Fur family transcriptional regulator, ferric uptake regulator
MIAPDSGVQDFSEYLARSGLKNTRQRERIVRAFFAAGRHTSAEELYQQIRTQDPGIGLVTVYRTLKLLRQAGLATERAFGDGYARFDPNPADWTHHHLICTRCGTVQEFQDKDLRVLGRKIARTLGFTVTEHKLELYGLCRQCGRTEKDRPIPGSRTARVASGSEARP